MDIVYLLYGAAFLALGLVIVVRNDQDSGLVLSRLLWLLAAFAFLHGLLEWMGLWRVLRGDNAALVVLRPLLLLSSFLFLFEFGRRLLLAALSSRSRHRPLARLLGPWLHAPMLAAILAATALSDAPLETFALWSRYLPGFLGSGLAAVGCLLYCRHRLCTDDPAEESCGNVRLPCAVAPLAFLGYGLFAGLLGTRSDLVLTLFHVPVELLRAVCAILIAWSIGSLLRVFHREARHKLRHALEVSHCALAELHQIKDRQAAILGSVSEGIVGLDEDGRVNFMNGAALIALGYRHDELMGKFFHAVAHHSDIEGRRHAQKDCPILRARQHQKPDTVTADVFWRKNGSFFPVEYRITPLNQQDERVGVVVVFRELPGSR